MKTLTDGMKRGFPQDTFVNIVWVPAAAATVETRAGNGNKALQVLEPAMRYEPGAVTLTAIYTRGLAYLQTRSGREAAAEFQKILDHRGVARLSVLYPLSHLGLGRAYALAGDDVKARKSYQDFLAMWKDADPDVPILNQAKQEYAKLL